MLEVGFWADALARRRGPDPLLLVDPTWAGEDRVALVKYLNDGLVWTSYFGFSYCRFACGIPHEDMGSATLTDGTWAWPEGLAHYVAAHHIALPDQFLEHARAQGFTIDNSVAGPAMRGPSLYASTPVFWEDWAVARGAMTQETIE